MVLTCDLSNEFIYEQNNINDVIGSFSANDTNGIASFTYILEANVADNNLFLINENTNLLRANTIFEFDPINNTNTKTIQVTVTSSLGTVITKTFSIEIKDLKIIFLNKSYGYQSTSNDIIGIISIVKKNNIDIISSLELSIHSPDSTDPNYNYFSITNNQLIKNSNVPIGNYTLILKAEYDINSVSTTIYDSYTINIFGQSDITLSSNAIQENNNINDEIGTLEYIDENGTALSPYFFTQSPDFSINSNKLLANNVFDYETKNEYNINITGYKVKSAIRIIGETLTQLGSLNLGIDATFEIDTDVNGNPFDLGNNYYYVEIRNKNFGTYSENFSFSAASGSGVINAVTKENLIGMCVDDGTRGYFGNGIGLGGFHSYNQVIYDILLLVYGKDTGDNKIKFKTWGRTVGTNDWTLIKEDIITESITINRFFLNNIKSASSINFNDRFSATGRTANTLSGFDIENFLNNDGIGSTFTSNYSVDIPKEFTKSFNIQINNENEPITDITLSNNTIQENNSINDIIGTFTPYDEDTNNTYIYTLTDDSNGSFSINENKLLANIVFDYEIKNNYTITVSGFDGLNTFTKNFDINILDDITEAEINLSATQINENNSINDIVGNLSIINNHLDAGQIITYSLVSGMGSDDNNSFSISGTQLLANEIFNYETKSSYLIRIKAENTDNDFTLFKSFVISISDINEPLENLTLTQNTVYTVSETDHIVGTLNVTDPELQPVTFSLPAENDNNYFKISGNELLLDLTGGETLNAGNLTVKILATSDDNGDTLTNTFTVPILEINTPTDILLSNDTIEINTQSYSIVGSLSVVDSDPVDSFTFEFVDELDAEGNIVPNNNNIFLIQGNELYVNEPIDVNGNKNFFPITSSGTLSIRVRVTDSFNLTKDKTFSINVVDNIVLSNHFLEEYNNINDVIGTLSTSMTGTITFSLVQVDDYADFKIVGNELQAQRRFYSGNKRNYNITIKADNNNVSIIRNKIICIINKKKTPNSNDHPSYTYNVDSTVSSTPGVDITILDFIYGYHFEANIMFPNNIVKNYVILDVSRVNQYGTGVFIYNNKLIIQDTNDFPDPNIVAKVEYDLESDIHNIKGTLGTLGMTFGYIGEAKNYETRILKLYWNNILIGESGEVTGFARGSLGSPGDNRYLYYKNIWAFQDEESSFTLFPNALNQGTIYAFGDLIDRNKVIQNIPYDIILSNNSIQELNSTSEVIGEMTASDIQSNSTTFSLADGGIDNNSFTINSNQLLPSEIFDYETKNIYSIKIKVSDDTDTNFYYEKDFTINISDLVNEPELILSNNTINENNFINQTIGNFSVNNIALNNSTLIFTLVNGVGDTDNNSFEINNNELRALANFDYENKNVYYIRVQAETDNVLLEKEFTINIANVVNEPELLLSNNEISENNSINDSIGTFSVSNLPLNNTTLDISLTSGTGDTDNASFSIINNELLAQEVFDYEIKNNYSIRVKSITDVGVLEKLFTINITDSFIPTITISKNNINENNQIGDEVADIIIFEEKSGTTFSFELVTGIVDNSSFTISGNKILANEIFDYETKSTYSIRIKTNYTIDGDTNSIENVFTININDMDEIELTNNNIIEGNNIGDPIGTLSILGNTNIIFSFTDQVDNNSFLIEGSELKANEVFNFNTKNKYDIQVSTVVNPDTIELLGNYFDNETETEYIFPAASTNTGRHKYFIPNDGTIPQYPSNSNIEDGYNFDLTTGDIYFFEVYNNNPGGFFVFLSDYTGFPPENSGTNYISSSTNLGEYCVRFFGGSGGDFDTPGNNYSINFGSSGNKIIVAYGKDLNNNYDVKIWADGLFITSLRTYKDFTLNNPESVTFGLGDYTSSGGGRGTITKTNYKFYKENFYNESELSPIIIETDLTINILPEIATTPTDLTLSNNYIYENNPINRNIGYFTTTDIITETFTYSLVSGTGDDDNNNFIINGDLLRANTIFSYSTKNIYNIRIRTTNSRGGIYEKTFTINIFKTIKGEDIIINSPISIHPNVNIPLIVNKDILGTNPTEIDINNWINGTDITTIPAVEKNDKNIQINELPQIPGDITKFIAGDNEPYIIDGTTTIYTTPEYIDVEQQYVKTLSDGNQYQFTSTLVFVGSNGILNVNNGILSMVPCFTNTCYILTPSGYKNVSILKRGDNVFTSDYRVVKIKKIFKTIINNSELFPRLIKANKYGKNKPIIDTYFSDNHAFNINGKWKLPKNENLPKKWLDKKVVYYHIKLPNYKNDYLIVNGIVTESWDGLKPQNKL